MGRVCGGVDDCAVQGKEREGEKEKEKKTESRTRFSLSPKNIDYYSRRLPHWFPENEWLFITFRLHGSLPIHSCHSDVTAGEDFVRWDRRLDAATVGPTWLKDARVAQIVLDIIMEAQTRAMCEVGAFVVLSNHVHLLLRPLVPVARIMQSIKGVSALRANKILGRTGEQFWQHESYDRWVRSGQEHRRVRHYIENNPVKAGLVECGDDWAWSSASFFKRGQAKACPTVCCANGEGLQIGHGLACPVDFGQNPG